MKVNVSQLNFVSVSMEHNMFLDSHINNNHKIHNQKKKSKKVNLRSDTRRLHSSIV